MFDGNSDSILQRDNFERVITFKSIGSTLTENGDMDAEMTHNMPTIRMDNLEEGIGGSVFLTFRSRLPVRGSGSC